MVMVQRDHRHRYYYSNKMALYKDEIYVAWDTVAGNIINHLYDIFVIDGTSQKVDIHIFLHQSKLRDQRLVDWPENFIFHFTSTSSANALQTSVIAYVLEKFERISRELELEEVVEKSRVFFIQDSESQFEELKSMLYRIPYIKSSFTFKLLSLTEDFNTEMLFQVSSLNKRRSLQVSGRSSVTSDETFNVYGGATTPRSVRHGRRASDFPSSPAPLSQKSSNLSPRVLQNGTGTNSCKHCDRRRGSQPKFDMQDKKLFCMACFLDDSGSDHDLCRICQRKKDFTVEDKSTMTMKTNSKNMSIQCDIPVHEYKEATTQTRVYTNTVIVQTSISIPVDLPADLQRKLDDLMKEIDDYRNRPQGLPELNLPQADDPFRLVDAQINPNTNKFDCPFCEGKSFAKISIFEVHLRNVHKKCNCSCERYFPTREDYLDHFYSVFPLPCFEQRKCPERFRSVPYQAIHHAKVHFAEKPYCCVICFDSQVEPKKNYRFKSVRALQMHAKEMGHDEEDMFLRVKNTDENSQIPLTGRASAINFSGDF
ncbi:uncharacterized protein [Clytia hemisphaerica]|uniref:C2H2-type domain-containing protein n=1 Tax=Clytia hemisphaerica TaxID=252671 RepID=A0A7M5XG46_9CNID